jgi:hypothetical protein
VRQIESKGRRGLAVQADGADPAANEQLVSRVAQGLDHRDSRTPDAPPVHRALIGGE